MTMNYKLRAIFGIFTTVIAVVILSARIANNRELDEIKPYITYTRLTYVAKGCDKYKAQNHTWPTSIQELQAGRPELVDPWDKDAWGHYIVMVPYSEMLGYGKILSYGRDGLPGGIGSDRDLEIRFPTEANADWNKQMALGLKIPHDRP